MQDREQLLGYLQQGIDTLLEQEGFDGGQEFRRTQKQALEAYKRYLNNDKYTTAQKLKGFFEIPTGVGKTAVFVGIVAAAHKAAQENGEELKTAIVVPTKQLLGQTAEAFEKFSPWMKNLIGFYGDGEKNLGCPITIMTYKAWDEELVPKGLIGSHNTDILVSDEGHRGTSDRKVASIKNAFNENTVQLAFTATAHFDETKSVLNSHKREIFYKSVADAIREGELASYVSSQRYVIRVAPDEFMLSDEFKDASDGRKRAYRTAAKQNAWNKRMVKIFRDGRDEKTGDLLSDNQAGFFVEGIRQADRLEVLLNDDLVLAQRTKNMGYEGVAVAIHSSLSEPEQKRRYEDYKAGKYLAVIGDEMFKEGFDHPPMKTLFDCPHSSVVDKAQILGRGLRKWWNELKDRYEGLTVIDTVVYFGNKDADVQKKNRDRALMNTVSVKEILEGVSIDGPNAPSTTKPKPPVDGGPLFHDDPNVEEYTNFEELYELEEEVSKLRREHWVTIPDELKKKLQKGAEKVGGCAVIRDAIISKVEGIGQKTVYNIIYGAQKTALKDQVEAIEEAINSLPIKRKLTIKEREKILSEKKRTGVAAKKLISNITGHPEGLTVGLVDSIFERDDVIVDEKFIDKIIDTYSKLRFITSQEHKHFKKLKNIRGINGKTLHENFQEVRGYGYEYDISESEIRRMLAGSKEIFKDEAIVTVMDLGPISRPIHSDEKEEILALKEKAGATAQTVLNLIPPNIKGLDRNKINRIFGAQASANGVHLKVIKEALQDSINRNQENVKNNGPS